MPQRELRRNLTVMFSAQEHIDWEAYAAARKKPKGTLAREVLLREVRKWRLRKMRTKNGQ
jgi:hypothetical protein